MKAIYRVALVSAVVTLVSCQTYDFEPVTPLAIAQTTQTTTVGAIVKKPNLMLLVDKSLSMQEPRGCSPAPCTRMDQMKQAMNQFLNANGAVARIGLTTFPASKVTDANQCAAANAGTLKAQIPTSNDVAAELQTAATAVNQLIQMEEPGGGTPTNASLEFLGTVPELNDPDREDFVLLLTDGLPNCSSDNPNTCLNRTACRCTVSDCGTTVNDTDINNYCRRGCLDLDGSVQAVRNLRAKNIRTIVVGFGSDFGTGDGPDVLNAMAIAGGFQRQCKMGLDSECGQGGVCVTSTNTCQTAFYSARNGGELATALAEIGKNIGSETCKYKLEAVPTSPELVSVIVDGQPKQSGPETWSLVAGDVIINGALCQQFNSATTPVKLEIRVVQAL